MTKDRQLKQLKMIENNYYINRERDFKEEDNNLKEYKRLLEIESNRVSENAKKRKIIENKRESVSRIKKSLIMSGLGYIVEQVLKNINVDDVYNRRFMYIESVIDDDYGSVEEFALKLNRKNYIMSNIINEAEIAYNKILEEKDDTNNEEVIIKIDDKDVNNYVDKLDKTECDRIAEIIADKVSRTIADFIISNQREKSEIKNIIDKYQNKIDKEKDDEIAESFVIKCNSEIKKMNRNKYRTLYEIMVEKIAENAIVNRDNMNIENSINMDRIIESVNIMYSVLETVNTLNILNINDKSIKEILNKL